MASSLSPPDRWIPRPPAGRLDALCDHAFAHRGLHGPGRTENGLAAFDAALAKGFGIECDVQATRDGSPAVVHDADLKRLTGHARTVAALSPEDLKLSRLGDGGAIPMLDELLARIAGRAPLLIEVKMPDAFDERLCRRTADGLARYDGPVGVMSFDPRVGRWFADQAPAVTRGLVASNEGRSGRLMRLRHVAAIRLARPDFLAWDIRDLPDPIPAAARRRGLGVFTWTVRTPDERARAAAYSDQPIFEEVA